MNHTRNSVAMLSLKCLLFAGLSAAIATPLQVLTAILQEQHGAPAFVTLPFLSYSFLMKVLFAAGYLLFGYKLPIKNAVLRGFVYIAAVWCSSYMPQVLGMLGGDGAIISSAFHPSIFLCDTIAYAIEGVLLGLLFQRYRTVCTGAPCAPKKLAAACAWSGVAFPLLVAALECLAGAINPSWYSHIALGVSESRTALFYLTFYGFLAVAGVIFPILYRFTTYGDSTPHSGLRFGALYSALIWDPVVLIMVFFGAPLTATVIFIISMTAAILALSTRYERRFGPNWAVWLSKRQPIWNKTKPPTAFEPPQIVRTAQKRAPV